MNLLNLSIFLAVCPNDKEFLLKVFYISNAKQSIHTEEFNTE